MHAKSTVVEYLLGLLCVSDKLYMFQDFDFIIINSLLLVTYQLDNTIFLNCSLCVLVTVIFCGLPFFDTVACNQIIIIIIFGSFNHK